MQVRTRRMAQAFSTFRRGEAGGPAFAWLRRGMGGQGDSEDRGQRSVRGGEADGKGGPGTGKPDPPKYTICGGRPIWDGPTYSAFRSVFGATCLRLQRLASSLGFGTAVRLGPRKNGKTYLIS